MARISLVISCCLLWCILVVRRRLNHWVIGCGVGCVEGTPVLSLWLGDTALHFRMFLMVHEANVLAGLCAIRCIFPNPLLADWVGPEVWAETCLITSFFLLLPTCRRQSICLLSGWRLALLICPTREMPHFSTVHTDMHMVLPR